jgi:hypothetical protein
MTKRNAANERIKRRYLVFLKDAKGRDEASVDAVARARSTASKNTPAGATSGPSILSRRAASRTT